MFKKKITLLLPLTFSPHIALLMWRFCPSDNGDHSGEYCSGYLYFSDCEEWDDKDKDDTAIMKGQPVCL